MVHAGKLFSAEGGFSQYSIRAGNLKNPKRTSSEVRRGGEKGEEGREKGKRRERIHPGVLERIFRGGRSGRSAEDRAVGWEGSIRLVRKARKVSGSKRQRVFAASPPLSSGGKPYLPAFPSLNDASGVRRPVSLQVLWVSSSGSSRFGRSLGTEVSTPGKDKRVS